MRNITKIEAEIKEQEVIIAKLSDSAFSLSYQLMQSPLIHLNGGEKNKRKEFRVVLFVRNIT